MQFAGRIWRLDFDKHETQRAISSRRLNFSYFRHVYWIQGKPLALHLRCLRVTKQCAVLCTYSALTSCSISVALERCQRSMCFGRMGAAYVECLQSVDEASLASSCLLIAQPVDDSWMSPTMPCHQFLQWVVAQSRMRQPVFCLQVF